MTDARQPEVGAGATCPDFESLSCYADGELDAGPAAAIRAHVDQCARCATLARRLRAGFAADDARRDGGIGGSGCGSEESLVLYALGTLAGDERATLEGHLSECDACLSVMASLNRRLGVAPRVDIAVPADVQLRARHAIEAGLTGLRPLAADAPRSVALLHRARRLLRLPVLVPAALAAGALLAVALQPGWIGPTGSGERSRAVSPAASAKLRVTAVEATVRSRPSMQSEVVGTVRRGALVEVAGEERDWYEVRLDGGRPGWVEREAFE